jgi:hypothetical protein
LLRFWITWDDSATGSHSIIVSDFSFLQLRPLPLLDHVKLSGVRATSNESMLVTTQESSTAGSDVGQIDEQIRRYLA